MSVLVNGMMMPNNCLFCLIEQDRDDQAYCPLLCKDVTLMDRWRDVNCPLEEVEGDAE